MPLGSLPTWPQGFWAELYLGRHRLYPQRSQGDPSNLHDPRDPRGYSITGKKRLKNENRLQRIKTQKWPNRPGEGTGSPASHRLSLPLSLVQACTELKTMGHRWLEEGLARDLQGTSPRTGATPQGSRKPPVSGSKDRAESLHGGFTPDRGSSHPGGQRGAAEYPRPPGWQAELSRWATQASCQIL